MKAVAIRPGTPNSIHSRDIPEPQLSSVPDGRGIRVKVLKVGVDATDREINEALYGNAPRATTTWCLVTSVSAKSSRSVLR